MNTWCTFLPSYIQYEGEKKWRAIKKNTKQTSTRDIWYGYHEKYWNRIEKCWMRIHVLFWFTDEKKTELYEGETICTLFAMICDLLSNCSISHQLTRSISIWLKTILPNEVYFNNHFSKKQNLFSSVHTLTFRFDCTAVSINATSNQAMTWHQFNVVFFLYWEIFDKVHRMKIQNI